nr:piercer of microtubule wall 1 protein [Anolis sagrei ordinatus]
MAQKEPVPQLEPPTTKEEGKEERTSDYYRIHPNLPTRFDRPGWFRGYRMKEQNPLFQTTNMDYGGKPPTVHEMPTCFHVSPHAFTGKLAAFGMYTNSGINTVVERSLVTGSDNFITFCDTFNFHPSYWTGGPSFCE